MGLIACARPLAIEAHWHSCPLRMASRSGWVTPLGLLPDRGHFRAHSHLCCRCYGHPQGVGSCQCAPTGKQIVLSFLLPLLVAAANAPPLLVAVTSN